MWYRKQKTFSGNKKSLYIGYDLWAWAVPVFIDKDYGFVCLNLLCFYIMVGWD